MSNSPIHSIDRDGQRIVLVPLNNTDRPVKMLPADFEKIEADGYVGHMYLNGNWVCTHTHSDSNNYPVGRIITDAKPGQKVFNKARDPFNLRRDNLRVITIRKSSSASRS